MVARANTRAPTAREASAIEVQAAIAARVTPTASHPAEAQRSRTANAPMAGQTSSTRLTTARPSVGSTSWKMTTDLSPRTAAAKVAAAARPNPSGNR